MYLCIDRFVVNPFLWCELADIVKYMYEWKLVSCLLICCFSFHLPPVGLAVSIR